MKFSPNAVLVANAKPELDSLIGTELESRRRIVTEQIASFVVDVTPSLTRDLKQNLLDSLFVFAKNLLQQLLNSLESTPDELPATVNHRGSSKHHRSTIRNHR